MLIQKGYAYIDKPFSSNLGVIIDFEYKIWRSTTSGNPGADGIGVYFFDADSTFRLGGYGGSLGYAPNTGASSPLGLAGGYLGIGIDEYGNFSNPSEGRIGGPGLLCNSITLRGPTNYTPATTIIFLKTSQLLTSITSNTNSV
ncbi:MAG: L-type lectin family protein, partial [Paludibacter sp.]